MNRVGIDVSNDVIDACMRNDRGLHPKQFPNTPAGHRRTIAWMTRGHASAQVCVEATGIYHLQLALALQTDCRIALMVANPRATRRFAEAHMVRAKTDPIDAVGLLHFLERMPFKAWSMPSEATLKLQALTRRLGQLTQERTRERNRLHAAKRAGPHTTFVQQDIEDHIADLEQRIASVSERALTLIQSDPQFDEDMRLMITAPGLAARSSTKLLAELASLPDDLLAKQWVAQAGLDPRVYESGSSVSAPRRISKQGNPRIREALFMPALAAIRSDVHVNAFYESLLARGKRKMQAIVAVMRKMLHALWGMLHHRTPWDGSKFYQIPPSVA